MLAKDFTFWRAQPIWQTGCEEEMNKTLVFKTGIANGIDPILCLACSTTYIINVNGKFVAEGSAKSAHGYHRVDVPTYPAANTFIWIWVATIPV